MRIKRRLIAVHFIAPVGSGHRMHVRMRRQTLPILEYLSTLWPLAPDPRARVVCQLMGIPVA